MNNLTGSAFDAVKGKAKQAQAKTELAIEDGKIDFKNT